MRGIAVLCALLCGCSGGAGTGDNRAAPASQPDSPVSAAPGESLVGLYEGNRAGTADQLCIVERGGGYGFGLVVWGANAHSCSGSGTVSRDGDRVRLDMRGDSPCMIDAVLAGSTIRFAAAQPEGCAYYCGARARLGGASFRLRGLGEKEARKATDLVGEPLCPRG